MNKEILLIGKYPPPIGGITVHIKRLYHQLIEKNYGCKILHTSLNFSTPIINDIIHLNQISEILKVRKINPIIHFHVSAFRKIYNFYILILLFRQQKKIITIHSGSFSLKIQLMSTIKKTLLRYMLSYFEYIVTVNNEQKEKLISILKVDANKIKIIPAFIKPTTSNINLINGSYSGSMSNSLPKIVSSGYLLDYYGYDMILDFFEKHNEYVGIIVFYGSSNDGYKKVIMKRIEKLNNVYYFNNLSSEQFNYILTKSDIYVRNTDRDGDCVAIREAGYWGLKICASNSVDRPKGAELFKYNDLGEFSTAISNVMEKKNKGKIKNDGNNEQKIIDIYNSI